MTDRHPKRYRKPVRNRRTTSPRRSTGANRPMHSIELGWNSMGHDSENRCFKPGLHRSADSFPITAPSLAGTSGRAVSSDHDTDEESLRWADIYAAASRLSSQEQHRTYASAKERQNSVRVLLVDLVVRVGWPGTNFKNSGHMMFMTRPSPSQHQASTGQFRVLAELTIPR